MAVVVSEETGQIALAVDGRIERDLDSDELRTRLQELGVHLRDTAPNSEASVA